eukprot:2602454-Rhodomonas_salina.1
MSRSEGQVPMGACWEVICTGAVRERARASEQEGMNQSAWAREGKELETDRPTDAKRRGKKASEGVCARACGCGLGGGRGSRRRRRGPRAPSQPATEESKRARGSAREGGGERRRKGGEGELKWVSAHEKRAGANVREDGGARGRERKRERK